MDKPKNIILDIGNVLGHFCWEKVMSETMQLSGNEYERLANCTVKSEAWNELDKGEMTDEEVLESFISLDPDEEKLIREFYTHFGETVLDFEYSLRWIRDMKEEGYKVYILSNFGKTSFTKCRAKGSLKFVDEVDGAVISYEVKQIKPYKDIYETLLKKYSLKAEECLFFDDLPANVEGARAVGINAVQFTSYSEAKSFMEQWKKS